MQPVIATARQLKLALAVTLCVSSTSLAQAETRLLDGGTSPNQRYQVQATRTNTPPKITYDLIRNRDGALLHRFKSSYQPEEGEVRDWSWNHSVGAAVEWSSDNQCVSIDEEVHRHIGKVLLSALTKGKVRTITLPEQAIETATRRRWDRQRIRHQRGWISSDKLSLVLAGTEADTNKEMAFEIVVRVRAGRASVISCHEI